MTHLVSFTKLPKTWISRCFYKNKYFQIAPPVNLESTPTVEQPQGLSAVQQSQHTAIPHSMQGIQTEQQAECAPIVQSESTDVVQPPSDSSCVVQTQLDQTARLLTDLGQVQHDRLSSKPPAHLSQLQGPSDTELRLGE